MSTETEIEGEQGTLRSTKGKFHALQNNAHVVETVEDIFEDKKAEHELRKSEEKFVKVFKSSPVALCITQVRDGKFLEVNKSLEKLVGYTRDELLEHTAIGLNLWEDITDRTSLFEELAKTGSVYDREYRFRSKNGDVIFTRFSGEIIDFNGEKCVLSVIIDITNYKKAEELLRKSEEKYRLVTENASDVIWTMDMNLRFTYVSPSNLKMTGYTNEQILELSLDELFTPESMERAMQTFATEMELEHSEKRDLSRYVTLELNEIRADGTIIPIEVRMCLLRDANTNPVGILGITREITERRKQEDALKKSEEKFVKAFKSSPVAISITRITDGKFIEVNESLEKLSGYSREELLAGSTIEMGIWVDLEDRKDVVEQLAKTGSVHNHEYRFRTKSGNEITVRYSAESIDFSGERCCLSVVVDTTELKKIEDSLRESEEKYRSIVENTKDVIILTLPDGSVSYLSPACAEIFGYTPDELLGPPREIFHPEDRDKVHAVLSSALQGKSGTNFEYRILTKQGEIKWISHSWSPIYSGNHELKYIVSIARDITESKIFEQNLKEKIEELERYKNVTVDREIKMIELKNEINELGKQLKLKPKY
jgi:PAS domain S-box-containing protein